ncbi:hypothetical protein CBL_05111 [Carabus blaptoides fortunei]
MHGRFVQISTAFIREEELISSWLTQRRTMQIHKSGDLSASNNWDRKGVSEITGHAACPFTDNEMYRTYDDTLDNEKCRKSGNKLVSTVWISVKNAFRHEQIYSVSCMEWEDIDDEHLIDESLVKHHNSGRSYTFLGISEESVPVLNKQVLRRQIWSSCLLGKNQLSATNILPILATSYSSGVQNHTDDEHTLMSTF